MKNKLNFLEFFQSLKSTLLVTILLFTCVSVWGTDFTLSSADEVSKDGITVTFGNAGTATDPTWYSAGLRLYASNTVTISSSSAITAITFNWEKQGSKAFASVSASTGNYSHPSAAGEGTWTGSATSIVFTLGSSGQLQLNTLSVTAGAATYKLSYANGGGSGDGPTEVKNLKKDDKIELEANTFTAPSGKKFAGWNDGTKTYNAGAQYTMPASDVTMTAQWSAITYTDYITSCGAPQRTLYLQLPADWKAATAKYATYQWGGAAAGWSEWMEDESSCGETVLSAQIPEDATNVAFVRFDPTASEPGAYGKEWNRTGDLTLETDKDFYQSISKGGDDKYYGSWAVFIPNMTVTFNANDHGTTPDAQCVVKGGTVTELATLKEIGWQFGGWFTDNGTFNNAFTTSTIVNANTEVFAKWTQVADRTIYVKLNDDWAAAEAKYAIHYFTSGIGWSAFMTKGTGCYDGYYYTTIPGTETDVIVARFDPSKETPGTWDNKWNQTKNLNLPIDKDLITITGKVGGEGADKDDYCANLGVFALPTYTITFNANGGTGEMADLTDVICGSNATLTANTFTAPTDKVFSGWATSSEGAKVYDNGATINNVTENIDLYAVWTDKPKYIITLVPGTGTCTKTQYVIDPDTPDQYTLNSCTTDCADYSFAGWSETFVPEETTTAPQLVANNPYHATKTVTLYAVYSKQVGGGDPIKKSSIFKINTTSTHPQDENATWEAANLSYSTSGTSYGFKNGTTSGNGSLEVEIPSNATITNIQTANTGNNTWAGSVQLALQYYNGSGWSQISSKTAAGSYSVSGYTAYKKFRLYCSGGQSGKIAYVSSVKVEYNIPSTITKYHSLPCGSNTTAITLSGNCTVAGKDGSVTATYQSATLTDFTKKTRDDAHLLGYFKATDGNELVISEAGVLQANTSYTDAKGNWNKPVANLTLYAHWDYDITYDANGGDGTPAKSEHVTAYPNPLPSAGENPGFNFVGWFTDKDVWKDQAVAGAAITSHKTLYAKWNDATKRNVAITAPTNGIITVSYTENDEQKSFTSGNRDIAPGTVLTITATPNDHYSIGSLTVNEVAHTSGNTYTIGENNLTIAATFAPIEYNVSVTAPAYGSITAPTDGSTAAYGSTVTLTADVNTSLYAFNGWTVKQGETPVEVASPTSLNTSFTMPGGDVTVSASVTELPRYTVNFSIKGNVTQLTEEAYNGGVTPPATAPIGDYTFYGWSEANPETETTDVPEKVTLTSGKYVPGAAGKTLYAVYTMKKDVDVPGYILSVDNSGTTTYLCEATSLNSSTSGTNLKSTTTKTNAKTFFYNSQGYLYYINNSSRCYSYAKSGATDVYTFVSGNKGDEHTSYPWTIVNNDGGTVSFKCGDRYLALYNNVFRNYGSTTTSKNAFTVEQSTETEKQNLNVYTSQPSSAVSPTISFTNPTTTVQVDANVENVATTNSSATIIYTSDKEGVATVAADGTVTGIGAGTATITASVAEVPGSWKAASTSYDITVTRIEPTLTWPDVTATIYADNQYTYTATTSSDATITYSSTNETRGKIDSDGILTGGKASEISSSTWSGTMSFTIKATVAQTDKYEYKQITKSINVKDNRKTQTLSFAESSYEFANGQEVAAFTNTLSGAKTTVTYSSNNASIAEVNETTGEVTVHTTAGGTATITATAAKEDKVEDGIKFEYAQDVKTYTISVNYPKPVFSLAGGTYHADQILELSGTDVQTYYYTTNGVDVTFDPSTLESNGKEYDDGIILSKGETVVKAIAIYTDRENYYAGAQEAATYNLVAPAVPTTSFTDKGTVDLNSIVTITAEEGAVITYLVYDDNEFLVEETTTTTNVAQFTASKMGTYTVEFKATWDEEFGYSCETQKYTLYIYGPAEVPFTYNDNATNLPACFKKEGAKNIGDYSTTNAKIGFKAQGTSITLWFTGDAKTVSFDAMVNGTWSELNSFKVSTSTDGNSWTVLHNFTGTTAMNTTPTNYKYDLADGVHYIKWSYDSKTSGNVGLGNIKVLPALLDLEFTSGTEDMLLRPSELRDWVVTVSASDYAGEITYTPNTEDYVYYYGGQIYAGSDAGVTTFTVTAPSDDKYKEISTTVKVEVCGTYTREASKFSAGTISTICLPNAVMADFFEGCTVYEITGKELQGGDPYKVFFDQVFSMEAGKPYVVELDENATEAKFFYSGTAVDEPNNSNTNGLIGTFTAIDDATNGNSVLMGNYMIYSNQIKKCGTGCLVGANKAYIVMDDVPEVNGSTAAPGRRLTLGVEQTNTPTNLINNLGETDLGEPQKVIIDNQMFIIRGGKMYNAAGALMK